MPEHTIPETLINDIKAGKAVLVVGAGIGLASWKQVLERMNDRLAEESDGVDASKDVKKQLHKGNLTRAAAFLGRAVGNQECDKIIAAEWGDSSQPTDIAKVIARLPFRVLWTTFPGKVLETAMQQANSDNPGLPTSTVCHYGNASQVASWERTLIKILGDGSNYAVTAHAVRRIMSESSDFRDMLSEAYVNGTLLFVGFRHGDPDLSVLLDRVFSSFEPPKGQHYIAANGVGPVAKDELSTEHRIQTIKLAGKGADKHSDKAVLEFLHDLEKVCEQNEITLAGLTPKEDDLAGWLALWSQDSTSASPKQAVKKIAEAASTSGDSATLSAALMGQIEFASSNEERSGLWRQLAQVYEEKMSDTQHAFEAWTAAMQDDPSNIESLHNAERIAAERQSFPQLVEYVSAMAPAIEDRQLASVYWHKLGDWYAGQLQHKDYALTSYRRAITSDPTRVSVYDSMGELLRRKQDWAGLCDLIGTHLVHETDTQNRIDLFLALGELQENQLGSASDAIASYLSALEVDSADDDVLLALERSYRKTENWPKLIEVLESRAKGFSDRGDTDRAATARRQMAEIRANKMGDVAGAIAKYEAALDSDPSDITALRSLENLYESNGDTAQYISTLQRLISCVPKGEKEAIQKRLAAEYLASDSHRDDAISLYLEILEEAPADSASFASLEHIFEADGRWYDLVELVRRYVGSVSETSAKLGAYLKIGLVYDKYLDDPHNSVEAYQNAIAIDGDNEQSLVALCRLYQRTESWEKAVDSLVLCADSTTQKDPASLWLNAGDLCARELKDNVRATQYYEKVLEIDEQSVPALHGLAHIHKQQDNWINAIRFLEKAQKASRNRTEKIAMLSQAAQIADEHLDDADMAFGLRQQIIAEDPEDVEAGERIAEQLLQKEQWETAIPVLEMLARKGGSDRIERSKWCAKLGKAYEMSDNADKAIASYRKAVDSDLDNLEAAVTLVNLSYARAQRTQKRDEWVEVDRRYRQVLAKHRSGLADGTVADIWYRLGKISEVTDQTKKAENAFRRALEIDPSHALAANAVVAAARAKSDWKSVLEIRRNSLDAVSGDDKAMLLEELGALHAEKLNDPSSALGAYLEALKIEPSSRKILHKVLEIYTQQKQWRRAIEVLTSLAELETSKERRAKYGYAAAVIARDELQDAELAVERFNSALDDNPRTPKAFSAVVELLTQTKEYKLLARNYRRMLKRLGEQATGEELFSLWEGLGIVCMDNLGDTDAASAALEVAASLHPEDTALRGRLLSLYKISGSSHRQQAIAQIQAVLAVDPDAISLYSDLFTMYSAEEAWDKAYCVAQALVFLQVATDEQKSFYEANTPTEFVLPRRRLTEELWQKAIIHRREDRSLNAVFSALATPLAHLTAQPISAFHLKTDNRISVGEKNNGATQLLFHAVDILAVPSPIVFEDSGSTPSSKASKQKAGAGVLQVANTRELDTSRPALLVADGDIPAQGESDVAFDAGKKLAYLRRDRYVNYALPTLPRVKTALLGALVAAGLSDPEDDESREMADYIKKVVPDTVIAQIGNMASPLVASAHNGLVAEWRTQTDLTANRAGFILCNDLRTAALHIAREEPGLSSLDTKARLKDLVAYSVSEEYFSVRRHLGLASDKKSSSTSSNS